MWNRANDKITFAESARGWTRLLHKGSVDASWFTEFPVFPNSTAWHLVTPSLGTHYKIKINYIASGIRQVLTFSQFELALLYRALVVVIKDGAYFCYCAYVVRISRYSGFLSVILTNTVIFLRDLKLSGESNLSKYSWYPKRKLGVAMHFWEIIKLQFEKNAIHCFAF